MMFSRFSQNGGVMRGLVIAMATASLLWLGFLLLLPPNQQQGGFFLFVFAVLIMGLLLLLVRACLPREQVKDTFWLSHDGASAAAGPYTVAQIVNLWRMGQITTRGMVTAEGEEQWVPIRAFADRFDSSVQPKKSGFSLRRVLLALGIFFIIAFIFGTGSRSPRRASDRSEELRNTLQSQNIQATLAHLQEKAQKEVAKKAADEAERKANFEARMRTAEEMLKRTPPLGGN